MVVMVAMILPRAMVVMMAVMMVVVVAVAVAVAVAVFGLGVLPKGAAVAIKQGLIAHRCRGTNIEQCQ